jgi:hypothetical protein
MVALTHAYSRRQAAHMPHCIHHWSLSPSCRALPLPRCASGMAAAPMTWIIMQVADGWHLPLHICSVYTSLTPHAHGGTSSACLRGCCWMPPSAACIHAHWRCRLTPTSVAAAPYGCNLLGVLSQLPQTEADLVSLWASAAAPLPPTAQGGGSRGRSGRRCRPHS